MTVVIDASALVAALVDSGSDGKWAESVVINEVLAAPELVLVESASVLRRLELSRTISSLEAKFAFRDLVALDVQLFPFSPFADRIWELRDNLTSYDAWYVALAEAVDCPVATLDQKLVSATGPACRFVTPSSVEP